VELASESNVLSVGRSVVDQEWMTAAGDFSCFGSGL